MSKGNLREKREGGKPSKVNSFEYFDYTGFGFYEKVVGRVFGPACVYGQVIKTRRNDHVLKIERRAVIAAEELNKLCGILMTQ